MIIVVGAEKGGVGKTALATNLAALAVADNLEVLLLDTDTNGSSSAWVRIRNEGKVEPNIPLLTVSENPQNELKQLASKYDLIIVDVGANSYSTMLNSAKVADMVLVPTGPDQMEVESTFNTFEELRQMDAKHKNGRVPAFVVLNQLPTNAKSKEESALREYLAESELPVFDAALRYRSVWRNSRRAGLAVHELKGREADPKAAAEMRAIFAETEQRA
ncbi:AAA family ATPase [Noviherbaspirillum sp. CPCC 100848]|uniref:AAA family ATPase n=1 Tax=Noviherbaspirillum album TaxID=3080276 RepID=A0ABU6JA16_9BURK|nr:AAA family ATPase [Noviherbaspirillum sp. CPCC 100848]MEC4720375.1 AAA family ATPase [Noviherbaspirillum sp. CPCC 100848]